MCKMFEILNQRGLFLCNNKYGITHFLLEF